MFFAAIVVLVCATTFAQQKPTYQVIGPDIVPQGEEFTIRIVENTAAGQVPIQGGRLITVNENILSTEEGGKLRVPPWITEIGNHFLIIEIGGGEDIPPVATIEHHVEVVRLPQQPEQMLSQVWRLSETAFSGGSLRVDGQGLTSLQDAALQGAGGTYPLNDSVGSSLQQIYRCPTDLPKGPYHFVAQDANGQKVEAPNTTTNPTLNITGDQIRKRGQRGQFVIKSDVEGDVQLSGGEPIIQLDQRTVHVTPSKPSSLGFTALQVGDYNVQAQLTVPDAPPPDAPRADANVGKPHTNFDPRENQTSFTGPITVTDAQGNPVANTPIDVVLTGPQGIQCKRLTTDKNGRADFQTKIPGQVPEDGLKLHCFRVLGHRWNKKPSPPPKKKRRRTQRFEYAVKFVCGSPVVPVVAPGQYFTAINVHNPGELPVLFRKKIAVALPSEKPGPVSRFYQAHLMPDEALEIDCQDILLHARARGFLKGFVVIESPFELDVVAVYSAGHPQVETMKVVRVRPRVFAPSQFVPVPQGIIAPH